MANSITIPFQQAQFIALAQDLRYLQCSGNGDTTVLC